MTYDGPGGARSRRAMQRCNRKPAADHEQHRISLRDYAARVLIESRHGNDDGTAIYAARFCGTYDEPTLNDDAHPIVLADFGLSEWECNAIERNGCRTVRDVRKAARDDLTIPGWYHCGQVMLRKVREALSKMDSSLSGKTSS